MSTDPAAAAAAHNKAFAAARLVREVAKDLHGNLAAVGAAPLAANDAATAEALRQLADELAVVAARVAELRDRAGAFAERHLADNAGRLKPGFGYVLTIGGEVRRATTAPAATIEPTEPNPGA